jgi:predicted transglutaminase-like cysteine proteinase
MYRNGFGAVAAGLLVVASFGHAAAGAMQPSASASERAYTPVYGRTLPPVGFVEFCARQKTECEPVSSSRRASLTKASWMKLAEVNAYVNGSIEPVSDQELYAVPERWDFPTDAGDCEDYVLLKKRYLERLGFPPHALLITVVLDEIGEGHAVLTITTNKGDFILDNRRNEVLPWSATRYRYLKRQSQEDPRIWLALSGAGKTSVVEASSREEVK